MPQPNQDFPLMPILFGISIVLMIWYFLIKGATSSSVVVYNLRLIVKLLKLIARKLGASEEEIKDLEEKN